jgi:uncharacterized protein
MSPEIIKRLALDLEKLDDPAKPPVEILWHGGEPLACGYEHFQRLVAPLAELQKSGRIKHSLQTNATLLNERWCDFFKEHNMNVSLSLDGPTWASKNRVDWQGREAYSRILRGIDVIKKAGLPLQIIAVFPQTALGQAVAIYQFFAELGCTRLGINLEDQIGTNENVVFGTKSEAGHFWTELYQAWQANPVISIREFEYFHIWWEHLGRPDKHRFRRGNRLSVNLYPTIGWQGDVFFLSPEFNGAKSDAYHNFVVGNLNRHSLLELAEQAKDIGYVKDFLEGKKMCKQSCSFYSFCLGGYASQKFFELGTPAATETNFCRNSRQELVNAVSPLAG